MISALAAAVTAAAAGSRCNGSARRPSEGPPRRRTAEGRDHALRASPVTTASDNLQRAENAGYGFFTDAKGIACIAMPGMGGMGVHFVDSALVGDPTERVRQPEALVYRIDPTASCGWPRSSTSSSPARGIAKSLAAGVVRPPVPVDARRQPVRPARVLLAARLGLVPQPGRHVRAVQPPGALLTGCDKVWS